MEHGARGGDELNLIEPGNNYGWPLVGYGKNYDGVPIPSPNTRADLAKPVAQRFDVGKRVGDVEQAPDGSLWMLEDASPGGLYHLTRTIEERDWQFVPQCVASRK